MATLPSTRNARTTGATSILSESGRVTMKANAPPKHSSPTHAEPLMSTPASSGSSIRTDREWTRSFCFVSDLVTGLIMASRAEVFDSPINLGNPREFTMLQLAEEVVRLTGGPGGIVRKPLPADDPKRRCPDISKARRLLGFEPTVALEEGLLQTIADFRARLGAGGSA